MRSIYVGVGGLAAGDEKDTCQEREKNGKMIHLEIKLSSPKEIR